MNGNKIRWPIAVLAVLGLLLLFIFQRIDFAEYLYDTESSTFRFLLNRSLRFFMNDALAIALIFALFAERKYVLFALWIQMIGLILFLLPYFILRIYWPHYNGPMISFLHRLIVNPTLILLLIPAFYFQKRFEKHQS